MSWSTFNGVTTKTKNSLNLSYSASFSFVYANENFYPEQGLIITQSLSLNRCVVSLLCMQKTTFIHFVIIVEEHNWI